MNYVDKLDVVLFEGVDEHVMNLVFSKLSASKKSKLSGPIKRGEIDQRSIAITMRTQKCLKTDKYDIGPTYLKSTIASAIRDVVPLKLVNRARQLFGMKPLGARKLEKAAPRQPVYAPGGRR